MRLWEALINPKEWGDSRFFAACPTRDQAKKVWWKDLKALTPRTWIKAISETDLCITTIWGAELWVIGLDKPARMEGVSWDGGVVDEYASCKPGAFEENIRPALADRAGWLWLIGVPDMKGPAQGEYRRMYAIAESGEDPEWGAYKWGSGDILPASEIASMRRRMDPRIFRQETEGDFLLAGGRAFPDFEVKTHVEASPQKFTLYDPHLPLCWSLDFNIDPMCSGVIQHHNGHVRILDELVLPDTRTDSAVDTFLDRAKTNQWNLRGLHVYGDPTGNARDTTSGVSDWTIIRQRLRNIPDIEFCVPRSPWSIKDTLNATNGRIKNADNEKNLLVHPDCEQLIKDLQDALADTDMKDQHCSAWLRYFCMFEYPIMLDVDFGDQRVIFA